MRSSYKTERRSDYFTRDTQCLKSSDQWQGTIGKQTYIGYLKILAQLSLKGFMILSVIGNPFAAPYIFQHLMKIIEIGQQGRSYGDLLFVHNYIH
jgi:hypothetical protein